MPSRPVRRLTGQPGAIAIPLDGTQPAAFASVNGHAVAAITRERHLPARTAVLDWPRQGTAASAARTGTA